MCGRFALTTSPEALDDILGLGGVLAQPFWRGNLAARYNIAPSQPVFAVRHDSNGRREPALLKWGLVPFWAKEPKIGARLINARAETVDEKPAFRAALKYRRCLVMANGFYEWQRVGKTKQPFFIHRNDDAPLAFAGIWETWRGENDEFVDSCAVVTTSANATMRPLHDRMPVILEPKDYPCWLDVESKDLARVKSLLKPTGDEVLRAYPVCTLVNSPFVDDARCAQPL
jgi:putative SOS response-associated peptidase YedK